MAMEFRSADLTDIAACVVEELRPEAQRKHIDPALSAAVIPRLTVDPRERQVAVWVPMVMLATGRLVVRIKVSCQITFRARSRRCRSCLPVSRHATRTAVLIRGQVPSTTGGSGAGHRPAAEAGRRFTLAFVLAVAAVCVLAGTRNFPGGR